MKVIFLDIDGVLNPQVDYEIDDLLQNNSITRKRNYKTFSKRCMNNLNKLIEDTGAKVVISSTWRRVNTVENLQKHFETQGFKHQILDFTPIFGINTVRGNEIMSWVDDHKDIENYVIVDDDSDMLLWQKPHFCLVDDWSGLTHNDTYRIKRFFNGESMSVSV